MRLKALSLTILIFCLFQISFAKPGDLDPGFGKGGYIKFSFGSGQDDMSGMEALPGGKILVSGVSNFGIWINRAVLLRYNPDGSLDQTFGIGGKIIFTDPAISSFRSISGLPDGRILAIAGNSVFRFNPDGSFDTGFGNQGKAALPAGTYTRMEIAPDGKIVAGGFPDISTSALALARLNSDGSIDNSFGDNGRVVFNVAGFYANFSDFAIREDGGIVTAGNFYSVASGSGSSKGLMAAYLPDGSFDKSFGQGGYAGFNGKVLERVKLQDDGRIVVAGGTSSTYQTAVFLRCDAQGNLDPSFNGSGVLLLPDTVIFLPRDIEIMPDAKIMASGAAYGPDTQVIRLRSDGQLDQTFGSRGMRLVQGLKPTAMEVQENGRIMLGGINSVYQNVNYFRVTDFTLIALDNGGVVESSFGSNGQVATDVGEMMAYSKDLLITPEGKLVTVGGLSLAPGYNPGNGLAIARHNADGAPDLSFAQKGKAEFFDCGQVFTSVALQGDKVVAVCVNGAFSRVLIRINHDGTRDTSFGSNGVAVYPLASEVPRKVAALPDGKILLLTDGVKLFRYNNDGSPDLAFGSGGGMNGPAVPGVFQARDLVIQPDGKVLISGNYYIGSDRYGIFLARFNSDYTIDTGFGSGGYVTYYSGTGKNICSAILLAADGKITLAGSTHDSLLAVRYLPNGQLDPDYAVGGVATMRRNVTDFHVAHHAALQSNGKIIFLSRSSYSGFTVSRMDAAGNADPAWGGGGFRGYNIPDLIGGSDLPGNVIKLDATGRPLVATSNYDQVTLLRLQTDEPSLATIAGRVTTAGGRSILNAQITVSDGNGVLQTTHSGANGNYYLRDLPTGQTYTVTVNGRRYTFAQPSVSIALGQDINGVDFVANE